MKKKAIILLSAVAGGLFLFDFLFWKQSIGVNLLIFSTWILGGLYLLKPDRLLKPRIVLLSFATFFGSICVVVVHSDLSIYMAMLSLVITAAYFHETEFRSVIFPQLYMLLNFIYAPFKLPYYLSNHFSFRAGFKKYLRYSRLFVFPAIACIIFIPIYSRANEKFGEWVGEPIWKICLKISHVFDFISFDHVLFILFAFVILAGLLYQRMNNSIAERIERDIPDILVKSKRKRQKEKDQNILSKGMISLKNEGRIALILFILLNIILFIVNCFDIRWVWFYWPKHPAFSLKQFVHEGTYLLILSILMAAGLILYYFRKNQNFNPYNRWLLLSAKIWIVQNGFLAVSVFVRTLQYINFHGLAYKRLGVIFYLALTITGLGFLYIKLIRRRTLFYVLRMNSWAAFILLIAACTINWNILIAKVNLHHWNPAGIDTDLYLEMPVECLPYLVRDSSLIKAQIKAHEADTEKWIYYSSFEQNFRYWLKNPGTDFIKEWNSEDWKSWNFKDASTYWNIKSFYVNGNLGVE